ncbi:DNA mismatch repair protein [Legionella birminghamensis]|uniref:DNA mismatch repair protein MutH n=1 Tax=Legionella birminghamensis TaxID=28083 RepID=A0A378IAI1_9GAMM|nr:DNA mismatch repair endonuclease MutH [Legionella birminghamensis]KTC69309.1 DNA mismatch repair protein [Legionella birminghamensis]STX31571.1 DNA mismatch repair protein mutH [Legionella birminghamensis]
MILLSGNNALSSETELLSRCSEIAGLSFNQLAQLTGFSIPQKQSQRKGWTGMAIEIALGTTAGTKAVPDFEHLGIELKTIPLNAQGNPAESTFVTSISLTTIHRETWQHSQCYQKLKRVLWLPVEGDSAIPFEQRRIGSAFLWSPSEEQERILAEDWLEHSLMIGTGRLEEIDASMGEYLQVRPKGANARSLCDGYDAEGIKIRTLPRGFYLRASFTRALIK